MGSLYLKRKANKMLKRLIIFLIRKKLRLKKLEPFRFSNHKSETDRYFFSSTTLMKVVSHWSGIEIRPSSVSLNWLLDRDCKIEKDTSSSLKFIIEALST